MKNNDESKVCNVEGCDCASYEREPDTDSQMITAMSFSERFGSALKAYLESTYGKGEIHVNDLAVATANYAEAFWITLTHF